MSNFKLWLQSVGLEKYGEVFASHDIDLTVIPDLTEQDLEKLGLSLGHRRKFMAAAAKFRGVPTSSPVASAQAQPVDQLAPAVERRQLTVVFVDLVGSTALGTELDPEDLIQLLRKYRDTCTAAIGKYDVSRNTLVTAYSCISAFRRRRSTQLNARCGPDWKSWRKSDT